jgi:hypothetical protein
VAVGDTYRVSITATGQGSIYQNTYCVQAKFEPDPTAAQFITFVNNAVTLWLAGQHITIAYTEWSAKQLWGEGMTMVQEECRREGGREFGGPLTQTGTYSATDALPPQSAMVVTWLTGNTGRRKRGRTYGFGQVEGGQSEGTWTSAWLTSQTTRLDTFINLYRAVSGTSPDFTLAIWSERLASGCVPAPPPNKGHVRIDTPHPELATTPVTAYVLRPTVYSQRRRTRGVGR